MREIIRDAIFVINASVPGGTRAIEAVQAVREALGEKGLGANCHVGTAMQDGDEQCVEWYGGQLLDIWDNAKWFAMNSLINCVDRFCPGDAR